MNNTCILSTVFRLRKRNDLYENFEKRGGSREKGGGGNEIHAPCACGIVQQFLLTFLFFNNVIAAHSRIMGTSCP